MVVDKLFIVDFYVFEKNQQKIVWFFIMVGDKLFIVDFYVFEKNQQKIIWFAS